MLKFLARRLGVMALTMICLSLVVFFFVNLEPNLRRLAIFQTEMRASDQDLENWLSRNGYRDNFFVRYGRWIGVMPKHPVIDPNDRRNRAALPLLRRTQGADLLRRPAGRLRLFHRLQDQGVEPPAPGAEATGLLMFWVMITMVPCLAGHRRARRHAGGIAARPLPVVLSITSTATPEYVSGIIFSVIFATWLGILNGSAATATSEGINFYNFTLPVMTLAIYGIGYIARMTRASMAEVMSAQYIRTARLKGLSFANVVLKHALRNALIAPFTVIMLQFPWLLSGVVVVEAIFRYQGFGFLLVSAASNNDIDLVLACGLVSVAVVLVTQLISDIGYAYLNPRIRVS